MFPAMKDGDLVIATKLELISSNDTVVYEQDDTKRIGRVVYSLS